MGYCNVIFLQLNTGLQLSAVSSAICSPIFGFVGHPYLNYVWYQVYCRYTVVCGYIFVLRFATALSTLSSGIGYIYQYRRQYFDKM